jgi:hypothetical protein
VFERSAIVMSIDKPAAAFPPLRHPDPRIADRGKLRLGDCAITAEFPALRHPDARVADRGKVRLGDCAITAEYPARK